MRCWITVEIYVLVNRYHIWLALFVHTANQRRLTISGVLSSSRVRSAKSTCFYEVRSEIFPCGFTVYMKHWILRRGSIYSLKYKHTYRGTTIQHFICIELGELSHQLFRLIINLFTKQRSPNLWFRSDSRFLEQMCRQLKVIIHDMLQCFSWRVKVSGESNLYSVNRERCYFLFEKLWEQKHN
jgi:hypothetical protein